MGRTLMTLTMAITNRRCEDGVVVQVVQEAEAEEPEEEAEEQQKEAERVEEGAVVERIVHLKTSIPRKVITVMISTRKKEKRKRTKEKKKWGCLVCRLNLVLTVKNASLRKMV